MTFDDETRVNLGAMKASDLIGELRQCQQRSETHLVSSMKGAHDEVWGDWKWHIANRLRLAHGLDLRRSEAVVDVLRYLGQEVSHLAGLTQGSPLADAKSGRRGGYDLSVLPANLINGERVLKYFIPPKDFFENHLTNKADPYGLLWAKTRSQAASKGDSSAIIAGNSRLLIGSQKFSHTLLMNLDFYCPVGCSDCYKSRFGTRENMGNGVTDLLNSDFTDPFKLPSFATLTLQVQEVVNWLKSDPRGRQVYDVILSGGEPLMLDDDKVMAVMDGLAKAGTLKIIRICTGTLFLGLAMRFTHEFVEKLREFMVRTGIRITIQAHLACPEQFTPWALEAVKRLRFAGISIYSQVPIKEGINFYARDHELTMATLRELCHAQACSGVDPYMLIVDMHPSTLAFYVPIERIMLAWGDLVESHDFPGLERPRTVSILCEQGNIILSGSTLFSMTKAVDRESSVVTYRIPRVGIANGEGTIKEVFEYSEPLSELNEDERSLDKLREKWLRR